MPFLRVETNVAPEPAEQQALVAKLSAAAADMLSKPERYVMVALDAGRPLMFGGTAEPAAFVSLSSIGLPSARCADLSARLCELLHAFLAVAPDRIYIDFRNLEGAMFGFDGGTF